MSFYKRARFWTMLIAVIVGLGIVQQIWHWEVERIEVPPGEFLVVIHRWGTPLKEGEIIAKDASQQGVMLDVLSEGRHFLNPILWTYERHKLIYVPPGECLVLTRMYGKLIDPARLEAGDVLARDDPDKPGDEERGIVGNVLLPGSYRLNPYAYQKSMEKARAVKINEVGVRTLKIGKDPSKLAASERSNPYTVPDGYRGVQDKPLPPGTYYINPYPMSRQSTRSKSAATASVWATSSSRRAMGSSSSPMSWWSTRCAPRARRSCWSGSQTKASCTREIARPKNSRPTKCCRK